MKTEDLKNIMIKDILQSEILDELSMNEVKAGTAPSQDCQCDHGSCNDGGTLNKQN